MDLFLILSFLQQHKDRYFASASSFSKMKAFILVALLVVFAVVVMADDDEEKRGWGWGHKVNLWNVSIFGDSIIIKLKIGQIINLSWAKDRGNKFKKTNFKKNVCSPDGRRCKKYIRFPKKINPFQFQGGPSVDKIFQGKNVFIWYRIFSNAYGPVTLCVSY